MDIFLWVVVLIVLIRGLTTLPSLFKSFSWLKSFEIDIKPIQPHKHNFVYILIPVLREQKRIIPTLKYFVKHFGRNKFQIVVITTQKEFKKPIFRSSTFSIVRNFILKNKLEQIVTYINYPSKTGGMAHQLNFALSKIKNRNAFIAVYNADSRPHPKTFIFFHEELERNPNGKAFQQSAIFLKNYQEIDRNKNLAKSLFLRASAILQTRWTLAHEIPRLLRQSTYYPKFLQKFVNAHVVGHGLIIKINVLREIGGFPTSSLTEDLFLGYLLRSKGINIYPIPVLEFADAPASVLGLWNQKYVWFWGPMKYFSYFKFVLKNREKLAVNDMFVPFILTIQGLISAIAWIVSGPLILVALLSFIISSNYFLIFCAYFSVLIYGPLQYALVYQRFVNSKILQTILIGIASIPAIIFHSIPPIFSIINEIKHSFVGKEIYKPKTDD
ncbi:MAG: hypothetical protein UR29_C0002G0016 [Candidatus Woesebacteria bacterium GW2011_GWC2_33_12]|uniref:Glycosyltransferase 2-like domain-containing protein n=1 Tax=Candidatus Woesebacteria bacterium GW2011_GWB1_33_22 TaxID=1618566 RepID=A0A0G0A254_9BACT|nr:MAG: hypothetical protein UR29_C0002G0016 [Candidatus Woesebacteria bacterium GW2011_GWC2_33_12]KKP42488.1 MAG: hypothetical protein UR33_C0002G0064 [Candidatus Woesebacteria bacterium GW2011_GWA2_33_20]KKP45231.1 MAG: hypothetical protein UR35_C0002G0064 [Candidatus Woesebacteria bacterium GW2011_GWB1_33_22]KKP46474.1 MAG: hypothetical protein UR37_C0007G0031 [Microgenomates group bacterium GW2011_GWC1_33_28]KKP50901.1 MAG: hypothetical protein UR41_C0002G0065 [Candidatus Woesebacteria bact